MNIILYKSCYHFNQHYWNYKQLDKNKNLCVNSNIWVFFNPGPVTIWLLNLPIFKYQTIVYWCFVAFKPSHLSISIHTENSLMPSHTTILLRDEGSCMIIAILITHIFGVAAWFSDAWEWLTVMFALKFSLRKQFYYLTYQKSFTEFCLYVNSRKSRYKIYSFEGWTILTKTVLCFMCLLCIPLFVFVCFFFNILFFDVIWNFSCHELPTTKRRHLYENILGALLPTFIWSWSL